MRETNSGALAMMLADLSGHDLLSLTNGGRVLAPILLERFLPRGPDALMIRENEPGDCSIWAFGSWSPQVE